MRMLIAEDDPTLRRVLEASLVRAGYEVVLAEHGGRAWEILRSDDAPRLAVLDWMMPEIDGLEVCRKVRSREGPGYVYIIMLTARGRKEDIVEGLESGADDYLTKPFDPHELRSRVRVGERILTLESAFQSKVLDLQAAILQVEQLKGLLPICMYCKKIRDEKDNWHRLESYIQQRSEARFTHSLCEDCMTEHYPGVAARS